MCVCVCVCRSCFLLRPPCCAGANAVRRHLPTKLGQKAQQMLHIYCKSMSIENKSLKTVLVLFILVVWKIYCAGWKTKNKFLRSELGFFKLLHVIMIYIYVYIYTYIYHQQSFSRPLWHLAHERGRNLFTFGIFL
jgi:hypothetical protein